MVQAVREIGGVQEAERQRRQDFRLLPPPGSLFDELGGVPFGEEDIVAPGIEPLAEQTELGALARSVDPLHDNELARVGMGNRRGGFRDRRGHASGSSGVVVVVNRIVRSKT